MICHYCEKEILENESQTTLRNNKTEQIIFVHYPVCHVRFTTFYKTEKELNEWKKNGFVVRSK